MRTRQACWSIGSLAVLAVIVLIASQALQSGAQPVEKSDTPTNGYRGTNPDGAQGLPANASQPRTPGNGNQGSVPMNGIKQGLHWDARQGTPSLSLQDEKHCKASDVIGMQVRGLNGDVNIGSITDLMLGQDGRVRYVAVSFGGFLGLGDKLFAVPFDAIDFVKVNNEAYARIDVTEATLKEKKGFDQDKWPADADRSFTNANLRRQASTGIAR